MRLMEPSEAIEHTKALRGSWMNLNSDILLLWTDDNSNYAGVFFQGDLAPRVAIIDHEETEDTPRFFSVESFEAARNAGIDQDQPWYEFLPDYPVTSAEYPMHDTDRELALKYLADYRRRPDKARHLAFYALNLLPPGDTPIVCEFLWSDDMWVQERVCAIIGHRRYAPATQDLHEMALRGSHNGRIAAILALKKIRSPDARECLASLKRDLGDSFAPYFR